MCVQPEVCGTTLRGYQLRPRLPPKAAPAVSRPKARPRRCINRAKRTTRRVRTTPPKGGHELYVARPSEYLR